MKTFNLQGQYTVRVLFTRLTFFHKNFKRELKSWLQNKMSDGLTVHEEAEEQMDRASVGTLRSIHMAWTNCDHLQKVETSWLAVVVVAGSVGNSCVSPWRRDKAALMEIKLRESMGAALGRYGRLMLLILYWNAEKFSSRCSWGKKKKKKKKKKKTSFRCSILLESSFGNLHNHVKIFKFERGMLFSRIFSRLYILDGN